jgi:predicted kinase
VVGSDDSDRPLVVPLLLLVGVPGSGKSTWAREFVATHRRYLVVSTDAIRAELYGDESIQGDWDQVWQRVLTQWQAAVEAIYRGNLEGVIYDATNARRRHRRHTLAAARQIGFTSITLAWFDLPLRVALDRNRQRSRQVPGAVIATMYRQLQGAPPALGEGVDRLIHCRAHSSAEL